MMNSFLSLVFIPLNVIVNITTLTYFHVFSCIPSTPWVIYLIKYLSDISPAVSFAARHNFNPTFHVTASPLLDGDIPLPSQMSEFPLDIYTSNPSSSN
jgi:hypothetical protein